MGKPCPREFREDVVRVAPRRDPGVTASKRMPARRTSCGHSPAVIDIGPSRHAMISRIGVPLGIPARVRHTQQMRLSRNRFDGDLSSGTLIAALTGRPALRKVLTQALRAVKRRHLDAVPHGNLPTVRRLRARMRIRDSAREGNGTVQLLRTQLALSLTCGVAYTSNFARSGE